MLRMQAGALLLTIVIAGAAFGAVPGRLPLQLFSAAEGLASDNAVTVFSDSRGYLWIGTRDGLSRYDGRRFVNYFVDDGLPHRVIGDIVEDRNGALWIGTSGGVVRMDANAPANRPFALVEAPKLDYMFMGAVHIDHRGVPWAACGHGLCVYENGRFRVDETFRAAGGRGEVRSITSTRAGELWVGTRLGVMRRSTDGTWKHYTIRPATEVDDTEVAFDAAGRMWISTPREILVLASADDIDDRVLFDRVRETFTPGMAFRYPKRGEVVAVTVPSRAGLIHAQRPYWSRDGAIWIGLSLGLLRLKAGAVDLLDGKSGLPKIGVAGIGEDAAGNLWFGTGVGAVRMTTGGAITFTTDHGLADDRIQSIVDGQDAVCVTNPQGISCFGDDGAIQSARLIPPSIKYEGWGWNRIVVQDEKRQWWVASGEGLVQWPPVQNVEELNNKTARIYTPRDGLAATEIFRVWQDSKRNLWISGFGNNVLTRRDAATGRFVVYPNFPEFPQATVTAFAEDHAGNIWLGYYRGGLARLRDGRHEAFIADLPGTFVRDLLVDRKGRLWMATVWQGVARIEDPTAKRISVTRYLRRDGLSSDAANCLAETASGRIAIGTTRGLDLLDPDTGHVLHFTTADGLPSNEIVVVHSDRQANLWVGTQRGLARLPLPPDALQHSPPQPRILSIAINGVPALSPALGTTSSMGLRVQHPQRRMTIAFGAPYFNLAQPLRFEYRLSGDVQWTDAGARREAAYDRLPYGKGTFEVRTVNMAGAASPVSRVSFDVIAPLWLRPWFLALAAAILIAAATFVHRYRVAHVLAMERLRRRVATDLHDDLGSSLSRISILSEVAKESADGKLLEEIGDTARDLVDALGDSIWSVDPQRDDVQSLLSRVRHFAAEMLEAKSMALEFRVPPDLASIPLDPERRRELYLILKEALNNTAKHSDARRVIVAGAVEHGQLRLVVEDDGKGFSSTPSERREDGGRGVTNMSERARRVGGTVSVVSQPGAGTRVSIAVPVS